MNSQQLESFLDDHEDISIERLNVLNDYTATQISEVNTLLDTDRKKMLAKETLMKDAVRKQNEHLKKKSLNCRMVTPLKRWMLVSGNRSQS